MENIERQLFAQYSWNAYQSMPATFKPQVESCLLMQFVVQSPKDLNQDYADWQSCATLLSSNNSFRDLFLECWEVGSFEKLRNQEILQTEKSTPLSGTTIIHYGSTFTEVHGDSYTYGVNSEMRQERIMKWLSEFDYGPIQRDTYSKRAQGTGEWFLKSPKFSQWLDTGSKRILWCPGLPGVGKTVISSLVVHHLEDLRKTPVCVTYLYYKRRSQQSMSHILLTILRQLYELYEPAMDVIKDFYKSHSSRSHPTTTELLNAVIAASEYAENIWVMLDGLDEYLEVYSDDEIVVLRDTLLAIPNLKLMVTSRVIGNMQRIFEGGDVVEQEISSLEADIVYYIDHRIEMEIPKRYHRELKEKIREHVIKSAKNRFLLVKLHMDLITSRLTLGEMRDAVDTLTEEIDQVYRQTIDRINQQAERQRDLAHSILMWVVCTHRHLKLKELQHALAAGPGRQQINDYLYAEDLLTSVCAGLIVIHRELGVVQLVHHTAQEFFECTRQEYFPSAESRIVESFSHYLNINPGPYNRAPSNVFTLLDDLPLYRYIADYLEIHLKSSGGTLIDPNETTLNRGLRLLMTIRCADGHYPLVSWNQPGWKPAHFAAAMNLVPLLDNLLKIDPKNANVRDKETGFTPLVCAVRVAAKDVIEYLFNLGVVDPNDREAAGDSLLAVAARHGHTEIMELLLSTPGIDINSRNKIGRTPFHDAVIYDRFSVFETLLSHPNIDVNAQDKKLETPLFHATRYRQAEMTNILLHDPRVDLSPVNKHGQNPLALALAEAAEPMARLHLQRNAFPTDFQDKDGRTYLSLTAENGMTELFQEILQFPNCPINLPDKMGRTPFSYACHNGHIEIVRILLSIPQVNRDLADSDGHTPLYLACRAGELDVVEALLEAGQVNPDHPDNQGKTPLSCAVNYRKTIIVQRLLREAVDPNFYDITGRTPLSHAAAQQNEAIVRLLLRNGALVDQQDKEGKTPLSHSVANYRDNVEVAKILLDAGADIEAQDNEGRTPLIAFNASSYSYGDDCVVQLLLSRGARTDTRDFHGRNAFWYATGRWYSEPARYLAGYMSDFDSGDNNGQTPFIHAASVGRTSQVEFLLTKGVNIHARDKHGRTALHYVAAYGDMKEDGPTPVHYWELVKTLLNVGMDVNPVDEDGRTPVDYAKKMEMYNTLLEHGGERSSLPPLKWIGVYYTQLQLEVSDNLVLTPHGKAFIAMALEEAMSSRPTSDSD